MQNTFKKHIAPQYQTHMSSLPLTLLNIFTKIVCTKLVAHVSYLADFFFQHKKIYISRQFKCFLKKYEILAIKLIEFNKLY